MIKILLAIGLFIFAVGFLGMIWTSEKGSHKGVNEDLYYGLFTISFGMCCVIAPIVMLLTALIWAWR